VPPLHACECDVVTLGCIQMSMSRACIFGGLLDSSRMATARLNSPGGLTEALSLSGLSSVHMFQVPLHCVQPCRIRAQHPKGLPDSPCVLTFSHAAWACRQS
jgi:hypothetical protein